MDLARWGSNTERENRYKLATIRPTVHGKPQNNFNVILL